MNSCLFNVALGVYLSISLHKNENSVCVFFHTMKVNVDWSSVQ